MTTRMAVAIDRAARDLALDLVRKRYAEPLYVPVPTGGDVVVLISSADPIIVADAPFHTALLEDIVARFGDERARVLIVDESEILSDDATARLEFAIDAAAQLQRCAEFVERLPGFLRSFFPIRADGVGGRELRLGEVALSSSPPDHPTSRCIVEAELSLVDTESERVIDSKIIDLCNFFAPAADGRARELRKPGRPFDEIERDLESSMRRWLGGSARERIGHEHSSVEAVLDLDPD